MSKLYHGTTETIAKSAPMLGIKAPKTVLTTCYGAYQALNACDPRKNERWAIVEILPNRLQTGSFYPYPDLKLRGKKTWQKSLDMVGLCLYMADIPAAAIGKVWVFNPESNWLITRSVIHSKIDVEAHKKQQKSLEVINRWLTGEFMMVDEWLGEQKGEFTKEQKDQLGNLWSERSGLDVFYHGPKEDRR